MLLSRKPRLVVAGLAASALVVAHSQSQADPPRTAPTAQHEHRSQRPSRPAATTALDDAGYRSIADRLVVRLAPLWDERLERYEPGPGATTSQINADLLLVHASAARAGHTGPARQDARARAAARYLTGHETWRGFWPGWRPGDARAMHPVFQAEVAEALAAAYRARRALGLEASVVRRIRHQLATMAAGRRWHWPALMLNQFNWYATIAAADATVNGTDRTLALTLRHHLARFTAPEAVNLGPGLHFRYDTRFPSSPVNFDSAEYANIVLGFSRVYGQARAAGMPRPARLGQLREWARRVMAGYWTHAGYLNWDTGLGFLRWHQRKKVGLAQGALIGLAAEPELAPSPRWSAWAKWLLDRGLRDYVALTEREDRVPAALAYGVNAVPEPRRMAYLAAARYAANAVKALDAGLGRRPAIAPPALYAFDPDTGRLAVTTPSYNTAIVAANQKAHPYGGIELARLFDGRQEVAANVGGTGVNAFGIHVRDRSGRLLLRTQYGARSGQAPLRLVRAPRGVGARATAPSPRAYAGPFTDLRVRGRVAAAGTSAVSSYRFTPTTIGASWTVTGRRGNAALTLPTSGRGARVFARLRDGRCVAVTRAPRSLAGVRSLHLLSESSGYTVVPGGTARTARLVVTRPQASQPHPGPTLELDLGAVPVRFAATITVSRPADRACPQR